MENLTSQFEPNFGKAKKKEVPYAHFLLAYNDAIADNNRQLTRQIENQLRALQGRK